MLMVIFVITGCRVMDERTFDNISVPRTEVNEEKLTNSSKQHETEASASMPQISCGRGWKRGPSSAPLEATRDSAMPSRPWRHVSSSGDSRPQPWAATLLGREREPVDVSSLRVQ